ncbi:glycosyltransferase family 2 protein [Actinoplanes sp. NPDC049668]|uniref:glycosyltransferase family 2 protein n=1 Tax=unclassified Actinoplanes TaxID=2626549 RepID=UPI0033B3F983
MGAIVLLPVYRPGRRLLTLITDLLADGRDPTGVVVVDDGSGPSADRVLAAVRDLGCVVLRYPGNKGKGVALKHGFRHVAALHPGVDMVTADGDGQHRAADIRAVAQRSGRGGVVLGARRFDRMPLRSRVGNVVVDMLFQRVTGRALADTQTGLRAYPAGLLTWLCTLPGERFEYEMNVLLAVVGGGVRIEEVPIPTIYLDDNAASNFAGLADSARVLRSLARHATRPVPVVRSS